jgi:hypothetical protein
MDYTFPGLANSIRNANRENIRVYPESVSFFSKETETRCFSKRSLCERRRRHSVRYTYTALHMEIIG